MSQNNTPKSDNQQDSVKLENDQSTGKKLKGQNQSSGKLVLVIAIVVVAIVYIFSMAPDSWYRKIIHSKEVSLEKHLPINGGEASGSSTDEANKEQQNSAASGADLEPSGEAEGCPVDENHDLPSFSPENTVEGSANIIQNWDNVSSDFITDEPLKNYHNPEGQNELVSNYDKEAEANEACEIHGLIDNETLANNLKDYLIYLSNANQFLLKFIKDIPFTENLEIIKQIELPPEIKEFVDMCQAYNDLIVASEIKDSREDALNLGFFRKFFSIKYAPANQEKKALRAEIEKRLDLFTGFVFSLEFQSAFFD